MENTEQLGRYKEGRGGVTLYSSLIQSMDVSYVDTQENSSPDKERKKKKLGTSEFYPVPLRFCQGKIPEPYNLP